MVEVKENPEFFLCKRNSTLLLTKKYISDKKERNINVNIITVPGK